MSEVMGDAPAMSRSDWEAALVEVAAERDRFKAERDELLAEIRKHEKLWRDGPPIRSKLLETVYAEDNALYEVAKRIEQAGATNIASELDEVAARLLYSGKFIQEAEDAAEGE